MRILEVTPGYYPTIGGVERHVQAISEELARQGHEVVVATMEPLGEHRPDGMLNGVLIRRFASRGPNDAYRLPLGLAAYIRRTREDFDVVHVHNYHAALITLVVALKPRALVVTPHLNDVPHSRVAAMLHAPYALIGRWAMTKASAVVCVSGAEQERVVSRLRIERTRTVVIPNGVDERMLADDAPADKQRRLLLAVGRLQPYKRIEDAISALTLLPDDYRLAIVGDGPHRSFLEGHARSLGVAARVTFTGRATDGDLQAWFRRAHTVLNLSTAEAFGMTVLEAVAAGCQVVCSDIPAFRDLAERFPEHIGLVGEATNEARAAAIRCAENREAPRASLEAFTWRSIARRLVQVFESVAGKPPTRSNQGSNQPVSLVLQQGRTRTEGAPTASEVLNSDR